MCITGWVFCLVDRDGGGGEKGCVDGVYYLFEKEGQRGGVEGMDWERGGGGGKMGI